jgi:hypothetical protein
LSFWGGSFSLFIPKKKRKVFVARGTLPSSDIFYLLFF